MAGTDARLRAAWAWCAAHTPLALLAQRITLSPRALRWSSTAALVVSILIILTGGIVRLTGSGLGCPTWPACNATEVIAPVSDDLHQVIEQTNRLLTGLLIVVVAWVIIAARLQRPRNRTITRLAWSQFWLVVVNAVVGGVSVLLALNPWIVAFHFVLAIAFLTTTTLTWVRVTEAAAISGDRRAHPDRRSGGRPTSSLSPYVAIETSSASKGLAWVLTAATLLLVLLGTIVTGAGPHSGDSSDVPRIPVDWTAITVVHGTLGAVVLVLAAVLLATLRGPGARIPRLRVIAFLVVVVLQGSVGIVQALTGLPALVVVLHLLGAALVWAGALRVLLDVDTRLLRASSEVSGNAGQTPAETTAAL